MFRSLQATFVNDDLGVKELFDPYRTSGVDVHHDELRFAWELRGPDGAVAAAGIDVGGLAPDGRLSRITGLFGEVPAMAAA